LSLDPATIAATAAEPEMRELLFALVRMLKPHLVVETGCYLGHTTHALGRAVKANGTGRVISCDTVIDHVRQAIARCQDLPVQIRHAASRDVAELAIADFIFSDSDYACRQEEIGRAKPGAVVVVHDTRVSYDSRIAPLSGLVHSLGGVTFATDRGFGVLVKV
jgi:predicted O-methyltransferase YrrM